MGNLLSALPVRIKSPRFPQKAKEIGKGGSPMVKRQRLQRVMHGSIFDCLSRGAPVYPPWLVQTIRLTGGFELSIRPGCFCR